MTYHELIKELKLRNQKEGYTRKQKIILEQQWFKDKLAEISMCEKCKEKPATTLDHIIPQSILDCFGIDRLTHFDPDNYAALCKFCNGMKGSRLDFSNPKTKPLMLKYLETI